MLNAKLRSLLNPNETVTAEQLETDRKLLGFDHAVNRLTRRSFAGSFTGAIALVVGGGFIAMPKGFSQTPAAPPTVVDVLNFALNLEYLEANLYSIATTGKPISNTLMGPMAGTISRSPGKIALATSTTALFQALTQDEINHITLLRSTITSLGGTPISMPNIDYGAKGTITTEAQLYAVTRQFTATGNGAYAGAAQLLVSNPGVLTVASQILGAEGQHLGAVTFVINVSANAGAATQSAVDLQDTLPSAKQYFDVFVTGAPNANTSNQAPGLAPARNTSQDLGIVYGVSTATTLNPPAGILSGGFFPQGVNGKIVST